MCDQDEHAKEQGKEQKKLQQLQQQKQEQQVEDEGCPREHTPNSGTGSKLLSRP